MVLRTAVRAHIVVGNIGEFLHGLVHLFLRPKFVQIYTFVLQSVEVPLHRRNVIWISGFLHAPGHMGRFAELYESFSRILAFPVTVQDQTVVCRTLGFQCFLQRADRKFAGDMAVRYTRCYAPVMEIYDGTVIAHIPIF